MRIIVVGMALALCAPVAGRTTREGWKVEVLKQLPPAAAAPELRSVTEQEGYRILDDNGQKFAEIWLRRAVPASARPSGPKGAVQFPFLAEGELLGILEFAAEGHDYRDQSITKGVYTVRYGLQPVNGDHLGVSTYRDYSLLLPAAKDRALAVLPRKQLEQQSAESAGTSHPAVFIMLMAPPDVARGAPAMLHDADKNTWSVVLPLKLQVAGESTSTTYPVRFVVVGAAQV